MFRRSLMFPKVFFTTGVVSYWKMESPQINEMTYIPINRHHLMDESRKEQLITILKGQYFGIPNPSEYSLIDYNTALTHTSYSKEKGDRGEKCDNFERFEFLGNYVLDFVIAEILFANTLQYSPKEMNKRIQVTSNCSLDDIETRKNLGIADAVLRGKGTQLTASITADAFEAFIGALYKNEGIDCVRKILSNIFKDEIEKTGVETNPRSELQDLVQKKRLSKLDYLYSHSGLDHEKTWYAQVTIGKKEYESGKGKSKNDAAKEAAVKTLSALNKK